MTVQANQHQMARSMPVTVSRRWTEQALLITGIIITDLVMILFGFWLAYLIRFEVGISWFVLHEKSPLDFYRQIGFLFAPFWIIVFWMSGLYKFKNLFAGTREYSMAFNACTVGLMLIIVATFIDPTFVIARGWVILSWFIVSFSVGIGRFTLRRVVQHMRVNGRFMTKVLIVGANEEGRAIAEQLNSNRKAGIEIVGFVDDKAYRTEPVPGIPTLGSVDSVATILEDNGIQEIIIASTALSREQLLILFQKFGAANNLTIRISSGLYEMLTTGVEVQEIGNVPLLSLNKMRLAGVDVFLKRVLDLTVSLTVLLVFWPIMLLIGIGVLLDSPGPVFYRRRVVGAGGKPFRALKFRTMYTDADARLARDPELRRRFEQNYKLKDDPRVTRIGRFLRRTSLDELPQLFNVLYGQMSLVGPRMITQEEVVRYGKWNMNLATVKPGITGMWQVSGRSDVDYGQRVMLDMQYIRNYSIWLDIYLLCQTVPAVLNGRGAY